MSANNEEATLVVLAEAPNLALAEMWVHLLDQQGVRCTVKRTDPLAVAYLASADMAPVRIMVLAPDLERARAAIGLNDEPDSVTYCEEPADNATSTEVRHCPNQTAGMELQ